MISCKKTNTCWIQDCLSSNLPMLTAPAILGIPIHQRASLWEKYLKTFISSGRTWVPPLLYPHTYVYIVYWVCIWCIFIVVGCYAIPRCQYCITTKNSIYPYNPMYLAFPCDCCHAALSTIIRHTHYSPSLSTTIIDHYKPLVITSDHYQPTIVSRWAES